MHRLKASQTRIAAASGQDVSDLVTKAVALYKEVWSKGKVLMLDSISE